MANDTDRNGEWETLRMELMDTLAVSELPDTSMTCAAKRALLDIGQYDRAGKPRRSSPAA